MTSKKLNRDCKKEDTPTRIHSGGHSSPARGQCREGAPAGKRSKGRLVDARRPDGEAGRGGVAHCPSADGGRSSNPGPRGQAGSARPRGRRTPTCAARPGRAAASERGAGSARLGAGIRPRPRPTELRGDTLHTARNREQVTETPWGLLVPLRSAGCKRAPRSR